MTIVTRIPLVQVGAEVSTEFPQRRDEWRVSLLVWSTEPRKQAGTLSGKGGRIRMLTFH